MKRYFIVLIAILMIMLCSCKAQPQEPFELDTTPDGYTIKTSTGGTKTTESHITAFSATTEYEKRTTINISFSGSGESETTNQVPEYSISTFKSPSKMKIYLPSVHDVQIDTSDYENSDILSAVWYNETSTLYIRFAYNIRVLAQGTGNTLIIKTRSCDVQSEDNDFAYYITANTYTEYLKGKITIENMEPTATREGNIVFISEGFTAYDEAKKYKSELIGDYPEYAKSFEIISMYHNEVPIFHEQNSSVIAENEKVCRIDGTEQTCVTYLNDGYYITSYGKSVYYERKNDDGTHSLYVKKNGYSNQMLDRNFESIENIEVTSLSRMAILENTESGTHLYIYDTRTGSLVADVTAEAELKHVSNFIWNEYGTALYILGSRDSFGIYMYDLSVSNASHRFTELYTDNPDEGSFGMFENKLYFVKSNEAQSQVMSFDLATTETEVVADGASFRLENGLIAVYNNSELVIHNLANGKSASVTSDVVTDFVWSTDAKILYYIVNRVSGSDDTVEVTNSDEYTYTAYSFDTATGVNKELCDIKYADISATSNGMLFMYSDEATDGETVRATYIFK